MKYKQENFNYNIEHPNLIYRKYAAMPRRTYEKSGRRIEKASDLDEAVKDKRAEWRASPSKERRRKRRYEKRLTKELLFRDAED